MRFAGEKRERMLGLWRTLLLGRYAPLPSAGARAGAVSREEAWRPPVVSEDALRAAGIPVEVVDIAALGGGLGSFVFVDLLRCSGVPRESVAVVGSERSPAATFERNCRNSQMTGDDRLRSSSDACPDNPWGFPGYGVREAARALRRGRVDVAIGIAWRLFAEPAAAPTYTPLVDDLLRSVDREAARVGWAQMVREGRVVAIRKTAQGRLCVVVEHGDAGETRYAAVCAQVLHLAFGHPALQITPEAARYRERHGGDERLVHGYEPHEQVYLGLRERGGVVVVRGRGIVASRVLQRLAEEHERNPGVVCVHLNRSRLTGGHRWGLTRRRVEGEFELQPFNWPKACFGGTLRDELEREPPGRRDRLLDAWGGSTTAGRRGWRRIVACGLRQGWLRHEFGDVRAISQHEGHLDLALSGGRLLEASWLIECTGFDEGPLRDPVVAGLVETYGLRLNRRGRLPVNDHFEVEAMRHEGARLYAAGTSTLGGPFAPVDSFLGLQFAALSAVDDILALGLPGLRRLGGLRSLRAWWRWARKVEP